MTIRIMQCVVVDCSFCDDGWDDGSEYDTPWHFETVEDAREYVLTHGWTVRDGAMCCPSCKTKFVCKVRGCVFDDDWRKRTTKNGIPFRARTCDRCGDVEYDPPFDDLIRLDRQAGESVVAAAEQLLTQVGDGSGGP